MKQNSTESGDSQKDVRISDEIKGMPGDKVIDKIREERTIKLD